MSGECCDGEHYHVQDDMGNVHCSYWKQEFNEFYEDEKNVNLCEICDEMGGPCCGEEDED